MRKFKIELIIQMNAKNGLIMDILLIRLVDVLKRNKENVLTFLLKGVM